MRSTTALAVSMLLIALAAPAAESDERAQHMELLKAMLAAMSNHGPVIPQPEAVNAAAAKTFNVVARSFFFTVTPSPFVVDQGDVVTLNISSNDAEHGLLMDTYVPSTFVLSGQSKTVTFTATTAGPFGFACPNPSCGFGHSNMFGTFTVRPMTNPPPQISSVTPSSGPTAGGTSVTISGANFLNSATIRFGGVSATNVNLVSSTTITAVTPAHAAGAVNVTVTNGDGQTATLTNGFTYIAPPAVTITSVDPSTGPTSGATIVTISGSGFRDGASVTIGGTPALASTVVSSSTITLFTPLGPATELAGPPKDVAVTNPDSTSATATGAFRYTVPALAVTAITPSMSFPTGGARISISGAGFTSALTSSVTIGGLPATNVLVFDAVTITATAPAHALGVVDVVLTVGSNTVTVRNGFAYLGAIPRRRATRH